MAALHTYVPPSPTPNKYGNLMVDPGRKCVCTREKYDLEVYK